MDSSMYSPSTIQDVSPFRIKQKCKPRHFCKLVCTPFPCSIDFSAASCMDCNRLQSKAVPKSSVTAGGRRKCRWGWRERKKGRVSKYETQFADERHLMNRASFRAEWLQRFGVWELRRCWGSEALVAGWYSARWDRQAGTRKSS